MKISITDKSKKIENGYSVLEIIVSLTIFVVAILLVGSMYSLSQKTYNTGSNQAELVQNARVSLDRISRELRQSSNIITVIPATNASPASEIFFQDGHNAEQITYLHYYLNGGNLLRKHTAYYFNSAPSTYVAWDSVGEFGSPPNEIVFEDRIVGEHFESIGFWGENGLIHIIVNLTKNQGNLEVDSGIYSRNY